MANCLSLRIIMGLILMIASIGTGELKHVKMDFWKGNTFHQQTVDTSKYDQGIIRAKTHDKEYKWKEYKLRELPDEFLAWNIKQRIEFRLFTKFLEKHNINLTGGMILDAGCGSGYSTKLIGSRYNPSELVAFDNVLYSGNIM